MSKQITTLCLLYEHHLKNTYEHTYHFDSLVKQNKFFSDKITFRFDNLQFIKINESIKVNLPYDTVKSTVNYGFFTRLPKSELFPYKERTYFFITDYEYINENTTKIYIEVDVMQTYLFDFAFRGCYVDRMHYDRWDSAISKAYPYVTYVDEDIPIGEYEKCYEKTLTNYKDNYLFISDTPLGKMKGRGKENLPGGSGGSSGGSGGGTDHTDTTPTPGKWQEGKPSQQLFKYIKSWEGFAPNVYPDSGNVPTIGYGMTENADKYTFRSMVETQPVSEVQASKILMHFISDFGKNLIQVSKELKLHRQYQFDALLDLAYNSGVSRVTKGDLYNVLKKGLSNRSEIEKVWHNYMIKDNLGQTQKGLIDRRKDECKMFFDGIYAKRQIPTIGSDGRINGTLKDNGGDGFLPNDY